MAAYRRVYDSHHLQSDCQEPGSAPEPYARYRVWATFTFLHGCNQQTDRPHYICSNRLHICTLCVWCGIKMTKKYYYWYNWFSTTADKNEQTQTHNTVWGKNNSKIRQTRVQRTKTSNFFSKTVSFDSTNFTRLIIAANENKHLSKLQRNTTTLQHNWMCILLLFLLLGVKFSVLNQSLIHTPV